MPGQPIFLCMLIALLFIHIGFVLMIAQGFHKFGGSSVTKKRRSSITTFLITGLCLMLVAPLVHAQSSQDFGSIADNLRGQLSNFGQLVGGVSALAGICLAMISMVKFRNYSSNPQDPNNKLSSVLAYLIVGVALIGLPELLDVGITSLFGGGSPTTTDFDGNNLLN